MYAITRLAGAYVGRPYNFSYRRPLLSANISKLFSPTQSPYNENITGRDPNQTVEILMLGKGLALFSCNYEN
jgi:hypothetical protein